MWKYSRWQPVTPASLVPWFAIGILTGLITLWVTIPALGNLVGNKLFLSALPCAGTFRFPWWIRFFRKPTPQMIAARSWAKHEIYKYGLRPH